MTTAAPVQATTADDVFAALLAAFTAADTLPKVVDGATQEAKFATASLAVGYQDDDAGARAAESDVPQIDGLIGMREQYTINNAITVQAGTAGFAAARQQAFAYLKAVSALLAGDRTLDGLVLGATVGAWIFEQKELGKGPAARIQFGIDIDAYMKVSI